MDTGKLQQISVAQPNDHIIDAETINLVTSHWLSVQIWLSVLGNWGTVRNDNRWKLKLAINSVPFAPTLQPIS